MTERIFIVQPNSTNTWEPFDQLTLYASQSDADAAINVRATVTAGDISAGRQNGWTYTDPTLDILWARTPAGVVFEVVALDGMAIVHAIALFANGT